MRTRSLFAGIALAALASGPLACSLFLDHDNQQCQNDDGCSAFAHAKCDTSTHLCVTDSSSSSSGSGTGGAMGCSGDDGCYACKPKSTDQFLNACTDAMCSPFDRKRLTHLKSDGSLPPLP